MPYSARAHSPVPRLGEGLSLRRMPAHWMLGRLGKRVMRPGGFEPSRAMVTELAIEPSDDVVEMWPGLGRTTALAAGFGPQSYVGIERGPAEAARAQPMMPSEQRCIVAPVHNTGLPSGCASVVFGEALLTLEPISRKHAIVEEAFRLLRPGGRYGIHELLLQPDSLSERAKAEVQPELTKLLAVGARPLTRSEWHALLEDGGFHVRNDAISPLLLLDPKTVVADEGVGGTLSIAVRALLHPTVLPRLVNILQVFRRYGETLGAITVVADAFPGPNR
jgi:hypothetical protein